jgi:hypothetical protein
MFESIAVKISFGLVALSFGGNDYDNKNLYCLVTAQANQKTFISRNRCRKRNIYLKTIYIYIYIFFCGFFFKCPL